MALHPNVRQPRQPELLQRYSYFHSLADFADAACASKTEHTKKEWAGGTMETAVALATDGWQETVSEINTSLTDVADTLQFDLQVDVAGDVVDIDLYLTGEPECMISYPLQERKVSSISIMVPICYSSAVDEATARMRGLAVAGAIEDFRFRGITVNVYAYLCISGRDQRLAVTLVKLADSRYAFDQGRVTYGAGHPTMLRQLFFAYEDGWSKDDKSTFGIPGGRGYSPYCLGRADPDVANWIYDRLDTEISIDLPELTMNHNGFSQEDHNAEITKLLGDKVAS